MRIKKIKLMSLLADKDQPSSDKEKKRKIKNSEKKKQRK